MERHEPPERRALPAVAAINAMDHSASGMYQREEATSPADASHRAIKATNGDTNAAVPRTVPSGTVTVRASSCQTDSVRVAATDSAASTAIAGTQNHTTAPKLPLTNDVTTPEPRTARLATASGAFCKRWAITPMTSAAIAHDSGADHTSTSPVAPMRASVPVPMPASARPTSIGEAPTVTASANVRRVDPSSSAMAAPMAPITGAGIEVSAAAPTAAKPNATTVAAFSGATSHRRDCTSVATSAASPPTSVHTVHGWLSVAAAAMPTGAVRQAASVASEVAVVGKRRRPASAAKYTANSEATSPENRTTGSIDCQLPATTMIDATSSSDAPAAASQPAADRRGSERSTVGCIGLDGEGHGGAGGGNEVLSMTPIVRDSAAGRYPVNPPDAPGVLAAQAQSSPCSTA